LADDLQIPDDYSIEFVISLGYPAEDAETFDSSDDTQVTEQNETIHVPKLTPENFVHYNEFGQSE
jgi:hypothetical protein